MKGNDYMRKYLLDEKIGLSYNASSKARDDIAYFIGTYQSSDGKKYHVLGNNDKTRAKNQIEKAVIGFKCMLSVFDAIKRDDVLLVQSSLVVLKQITLMKRLKGFKTIYLIHDVDSLRDAYEDDKKNGKTIDILNQQDVIISHNVHMTKELRRRGLKTDVVELEIFDYYVDIGTLNNSFRKNHDRQSVVFAGNLSPNKTGFLYKLDDSDSLGYEINVYGRKEIDFTKLNYIGCFPPEALPEKLEGSYGLIWEGNDFSYNVTTHPYIMYNNPHKASLYVVSGLPIIIWSKAALADLVQSEGIGVVIDSVDEIEEKISKITPEVYNEMMLNLKRFSNSIVSGQHVHDAIRKAEILLNI